MDDFDDLSIEESCSFDFVEEINEDFFDDKKKKFNFDEYLNGNIDY